MSKIFTGLITASIVALSTLSFQAIGDDNLHRAVIKNIKNKVEVKFGSSLWREASINQLIRPGSSIRTGSRSKVELMYPDGTITRLGSRTNMTVLEKASRSVKVESGKIWFKVAKKSIGYKVYSPTAVAAITGTEGFVESGDVEDDEKEVNLNNKFASKDGSYKIAEGMDNYKAGLVEGTMDIFSKLGADGEPIGDPINIIAGKIYLFDGTNFRLIDIPINDILNQYKDISLPDPDTQENPNNNNNNPNNNNNNNNGNPNVQNQKLDPSNPTTEKIPNTINKQQDINNSPTTGDLEIIIK